MSELAGIGKRGTVGFAVARKSIQVQLGNKMMPVEPSEAWEFGHEEAERRQLQRYASMTFRERLILLDEIRKFRNGFAAIMATKFRGFDVNPRKR